MYKERICGDCDMNRYAGNKYEGNKSARNEYEGDRVQEMNVQGTNVLGTHIRKTKKCGNNRAEAQTVKSEHIC
jgi:hypothetical protein